MYLGETLFPATLPFLSLLNGSASAARLSRTIVPAAEPNTSSSCARWESTFRAGCDFDVGPSDCPLSSLATAARQAAVRAGHGRASATILRQRRFRQSSTIGPTPSSSASTRTDLRSARANRVLDRAATAVHRHAPGSRLPDRRADRAARLRCDLRTVRIGHRPPARRRSRQAESRHVAQLSSSGTASRRAKSRWSATGCTPTSAWPATPAPWRCSR